jgi:transcriptional regulator with PAS, ATPase and Fis domain
MESSANLGSSLLKMIEKVTHASDHRAACLAMLGPLIQIFDVDQAAVCELKDDLVTPIFAIDRTKKIITHSSHLWLSQTLMKQALATMEPTVHRESPEIEDEIPRSISENSIKNVVCVPLSRNPDRVVYLCSQRNLLREFSDKDIEEFKIASHAAHLALNQHHSLTELKESNAALKSLLSTRPQPILFASPSMQKLTDEVARIAPFNVSILIQGESGVGKEEFAKEIHRLSGRTGPFVAVNCANLSETLLESELFGYVKGAFTGASQSKKGLIQEANGGTFFLDEIAELPLGLQAKLLRAVQERCIRPVGGTSDVPVDIRILAASHVDLRKASTDKRFREDLYYRIQEMTIRIAPLRERKEDVELLAHHFTSTISLEFQFPRRVLSPQAVEKLAAYSWPGNVRELKNVCRTAVILSRSDTLSQDDIRLPSDETPTAPETMSFDEAEFDADFESDGSLRDLSRKYERDLITRLLKQPGQSQAGIAKRLGVSIRTLQRIIHNEENLDQH